MAVPLRHSPTPVAITTTADTDRIAAEWRAHTASCHAATHRTRALPPYPGWTEHRFPARCACGFPALTRDPSGQPRHVECAAADTPAPARKDTTRMTRPDLKAAALACAERGFAVFPIHPGGRIAVHSAWETLATTDPARIERFWDHNPTHNVGIACGPSGLVVVDLDMPKHPGDVPDPDKPKEAEWARLGVRNGRDVLTVLAQRANAPFPDGTFTVTTRSGGTHLYFTAPDAVPLPNTAGSHGWKLDTRARGGYVIAAGSRRGGSAYVVTRDVEGSATARMAADSADTRTGRPPPGEGAGPAERHGLCRRPRCGTRRRTSPRRPKAPATPRWCAPRGHSVDWSRAATCRALGWKTLLGGGAAAGLTEREAAAAIRSALDWSIAHNPTHRKEAA
ncbi:bifunctional DNA primase/polymerase [Yinghuangia aomiensis]